MLAFADLRKGEYTPRNLAACNSPGRLSWPLTRTSRRHLIQLRRWTRRQQVRPAFGIQLSDYCLLFSLLLYALAPKDSLLGIRGSIFPAGGKLILLGSVLAMINASSLSNASAPFLRLVILFSVFAPLAMIHSKGVRKNVIYLIFGITVNSFITILQASLFPGIADALSINPTRPDISDSGRFQGLTSHPNIIGLSAALALLLAIGALITKRDKRIRVPLVMAIIACALAALLSGSRTVFVCFVPSLLVLIFQKKRRKAAIGAVIGIALLCASIGSWLFQSANGNDHHQTDTSVKQPVRP